MSDEMDWGHWVCLVDVKCPPKDSLGFVYRITDKVSGEFYIGIKQMYGIRTLPPLKNKDGSKGKRKRKVKKESDWRKYCSSGSRAEDIKKDKDNYKFEILSFWNNKTDLKIEETKMIIENIHSNPNPLCINQIVNLRVRVRK